MDFFKENLAVVENCESDNNNTIKDAQNEVLGILKNQVDSNKLPKKVDNMLVKILYFYPYLEKCT